MHQAVGEIEEVVVSRYSLPHGLLLCYIEKYFSTRGQDPIFFHGFESAGWACLCLDFSQHLHFCTFIPILPLTQCAVQEAPSFCDSEKITCLMDISSAKQ